MILAAVLGMGLMSWEAQSGSSEKHRAWTASEFFFLLHMQWQKGKENVVKVKEIEGEFGEIKWERWARQDCTKVVTVK